MSAYSSHCEALNHNGLRCLYVGKRRHKSGRLVCGVHAQKPAGSLMFATPAPEILRTDDGGIFIGTCNQCGRQQRCVSPAGRRGLSKVECMECGGRCTWKKEADRV